jgi:chromatin assembly factor 1 subunit B
MRYIVSRPAVVLPSPDQFTVAVKFCPILFELKPTKKQPVFQLPYRMIFAVATKSSVYLYDTQQKIPFGLISNIHYTRLTDLTWSNDGTILLVSSTDGYCSIVQFTENELGVQYKEKTIAEILEANTVKVKETKTKGDRSKNSEARKHGNKTPQQIAIKRKPKVDNKENKVEKPEEKVEPKKKDEEKMDVDSGKAEENRDKTPEKMDIVTEIPESIKELIPVDKIIRSDEKFESPEKLDSPVTLIPTRKHPRNTPSVHEDQKTTPPKQNENNVDNSLTPSGKTYNKISKTPTPIAVRRKPRILEPQSSGQVQKLEEESGIVPLDMVHSKLDEKPLESSTLDNKTEKTPKTPRRVEFRTVSTPKSKKKLIDN